MKVKTVEVIKWYQLWKRWKISLGWKILTSFFVLIVILILISLYVYIFMPDAWDRAAGLVSPKAKQEDTDKPKIYIVFPDSQVGLDLKKGIIPSNDDEIIEPGVTLKKFDQLLSIKETERNLLRELKQDDNILMVVGHETSTIAKYMIENVYENDAFFSNDKKIPIPLILPGATNPELTSTEPREGIRHILRVPATDKKQVQMIISFLDKKDEHSKKKAQFSTSLIIDTTNIEYGEYIAKSIIKLRPKNIIDSIGIGLVEEGYSPDKFFSSKPNYTIFIGMHTQAAMLVNQMKKVGYLTKNTAGSSAYKPTLLCTDGTLSTFFNETLMALKPSNPIYLTGPIVLPEYAKECGNEIKEEDLNYKRIGMITRLLIEYLVDEANKTGNLTREGILNVMQGLMAKGTEVHLIMPEKGLIMSKKERYMLKFSDIGDNVESKVHLFECERGIFRHSSMCSCEELEMVLSSTSQDY